MKYPTSLLLMLAFSVALPRATTQEVDTPARIHTNIYNGVLVPNGKYAFMAALVSNQSEGQTLRDRQFCGGTLIHPYWVLTAAHCLEQETINSFRIAIGNSNLEAIDGSVREIAIDEIHIHEAWDFMSISHDIALIKLAEPVFDIIPIEVNNNDGHNTPGMFARIAGWGLTNETTETVPDQLMQTIVPIVTLEEVNFSGIFGAALHPGMLPTSSVGNTGNSCSGDSGGPLFVDTPDPLNDNQLQLGIVSFGDGNCDSGYSVYTRISYYYDWIQQKLQNMQYAADALNLSGNLDAEDPLDSNRPGAQFYAQEFTIRTGSAPQQYQFTLDTYDTSTETSQFNPIISLLDGTSKALLAQSGDHPETVSIQVHLPANSTYIIQITSALPQQMGRFFLNSTVIQQTPDNPPHPQSNQLTPGTTISGVINDEDIEYIDFEGEVFPIGLYDTWDLEGLTSGATYQIEVIWNGTTAEDYVFEIIEPELLLFQRQTDRLITSDDFSDNQLKVEFQARSNRNYSVQLGSFTMEATGAYQLTFIQLE